MTAAVSQRRDHSRGNEHPYRAFVTFDAGSHALDAIRDQLSVWLREKKWDVDLAAPGFHHTDSDDLLVITNAGPGFEQLRARLVERKPDGTWRTELTAHVPRASEGWLLLDVSNDAQAFVAVPRLAKYLLGAMDVRDGGDLVLSDTVRTTSIATVEDLAEAVTDPHRNGVMFVAGTDERLDFDRFVAQVGRWTRGVVGQAEAVVLDPPATRAFAEIMGETHDVRPWTIRTYLPDVDPAVESDALRHRFLTTQRLAGVSDHEIERLLARVSRRYAANRALPAAVAKVATTLGRIENDLVVEAVTAPLIQPADVAIVPELAPEPTAEPAVADAAERYLAQIEMVKTVLGLAELDEAALRAIARRSASGASPQALDRVTRQLREQQDRIDELQTELDAVRTALEEEEFQHALTDEERTRLSDQDRYLRRRLKEAQEWQAASGPVPDEEITHYPASYVELLDRVESLAEHGVVFTADVKKCRDLDAYDSLGKTTRTAWEAMLVLADYIRGRAAGDCESGVEGYLRNTPDGYRGMPLAKHAASESAETMQRYGDDRLFTVPPDCAPGGKITMTAHFKLGLIGMVSPRLYYYDDVARTGRVYVGHIGPHLRNTKTN